MENARPNKSHMAIARLGTMGLIHGIITQSEPVFIVRVRLHKL